MMHPDIKKFWESGPPEYSNVYITEYDGTVYWYIILDGVPFGRHAPTIARQTAPDPIVYLWDEQAYTEEQMLRIIKLKVFL